MRKILIAVALMLSIGAAAQDKQPIQKLSPRARVQLAASSAAMKAPSITGEQRVSAYITTTAEVEWSDLEALGVCTALKLDSVATATIPVSQLANVAAVKGVKYVQTATQAQQMLDIARSEAGVDKVQAGTNLSQAYTGKGVVVGVVDAGFDYTHKAFYDANGNTRIKRIWEQSTTATGSQHAPEAYGYGVEFTTQSEIENAAGDISNNSHGTHVTNIAAGSDSYRDGAYQGIAPDADIVLVSMGDISRDNVNLTNAIAYIFDYAKAEGKPCVVNLSLGNHAGPHDGSSTFDVATDALQGEGRIVVGAAGNHRTDKFHVGKTFTGVDDAPLRTIVAYKSTPTVSNAGGDIDIWGEVGTDFEVEIAAYHLTGNAESENTVVYPSDEAVQSVSLGRSLTGTITVTSEISPLNGKPHVLLTSALTSIRNNYAWEIIVRPKSAGAVNIWADNNYVGLTSNNSQEGIAEPSESMTVSEIGGTGKRIISVGAYTTRDNYTIYGSTTSYQLENDVKDHLSSFSSCGPTADGRAKPEITAPGCLIVSAVSQNDASSSKVVADQYEGATRTYQYGYEQGTSMSSPFVAGVVATWLQACPTLTPEQVKEILNATARHDDYTATTTEAWGYGKIDAYEGLKKVLATTGIQTFDQSFDGNIALRNGFIEIAPVASGLNAMVAIYTCDGTLLGQYSADEATRISTAALPKGVYLLKVSDGKGMKVLKFRN